MRQVFDVYDGVEEVSVGEEIVVALSLKFGKIKSESDKVDCELDFPEKESEPRGTDNRFSGVHIFVPCSLFAVR